MNYLGFYKKLLLGFFAGAWVIAALTQLAGAQIQRPYEPIVLTGDTLSDFSGKNVKHLYLYAYDSLSDSWELLPFQIDEVNPGIGDSLKYFIPEEGLHTLLDSDDELVFMAGDLGDKADSSSWAPGMDLLRYEITFTDSTDLSEGFVYLYYSDSLTLAIPDTYGMAFDSAADSVSTANYRLGFTEREGGDPNRTGLLNDVIIKSGAGIDFFDRMKLRLYGIATIPFTFPVAISEDSLFAGSSKALVGKVRIIRNLNARLKLKLGSLITVDLPFVQTSYFYPYSGSFSITNIPLAGVEDFGDILYVRVSWDLNENASGMSLYSEANPNGLLIDGAGEFDNITPTLRDNDFDWILANGSQGSMLNIFYMPGIGDSRGLFYYDSDDGDPLTTGDPSEYQEYLGDSGDGAAFGDAGYYFLEDIRGDEFDFSYRNYFLPPSFTPEDAATLCEQTRRPLSYSTRIQRYFPPSGVDATVAASVSRFDLKQNYPNPFNATTVFPFALDNDGRVTLKIYDLLGTTVATLVDEYKTSGSHKATWNGISDDGEPAPSGVYFAKLQVANRIVTKKMLLVK